MCGVYAFKLRSRCSGSFTARARHLKGLIDKSEILSSILLRNSPVSFTTFPSLSLIWVHLFKSKLGAPLTRRRLLAPFFPSEGITRTDILFLSRLNSSVAVRMNLDLQSFTWADARILLGILLLSNSTNPPSFSAKIQSAAITKLEKVKKKHG